ncbi:rhamnan synthesis F family protein [Antricoccus suffuscus]|uniref:rhamnan synthesis F family protein n=1 Tax=Antricoccus suffuscus TaxID=1629062 RepID=UPI00192DAD9B|nr:rhamnan synthesis F family protein [Antricoccus suffuscus]
MDDYIVHKLARLREHAETIFVVSNSALTTDGRSKLESVADTVYVRENVGFDVWGYKQAMEAFGRDRLAKYDELVLMNYTFFGPVFPFSETFETMNRQDVDFWGITAHKSMNPNPFPGANDELPMHIQSHWIAVRKRMFTSLEFQDYWDSMPMIHSYEDSILRHESRFTKHFSERGFSYSVTFPPENYPSTHPIFENANLLLKDRCPIVKRRLFFHEPTYLERNAILGRRVMEAIEATDYPTDLIWRNVVRSAEPRTLYTNLSLLEVLPEFDSGYRPEPQPRIAVLAHIYYEDMVDETMSYVKNIPVPYDLIVTTVSEDKKRHIERDLKPYDAANVEVRVMEQNRGRDMSALLITCKDVLLSDKYDLICRVHSKKSPQNDYNTAVLFKEHMFDNLLYTPGYVASILRLFEDQPTLGMAFPPIVNVGYPTLGHSWFTNREQAEDIAEKLGITTKFDRSTPVAPYGTMFWFRPDSLRTLAEHNWTWDDYPAEPGHNDGGLAHVQERLLGYAAMNEGYHLRSIINRDWASINYAFLEYKLQRVASRLPHFTQDQMDYLDRIQAGHPLLSAVKDAVDRRFPRVGHGLRPLYRLTRRAYRAGRSPHQAQDRL